MRPWTAAALLIALLSLTGIPPLAGFIGKLMLFGATIEGGYVWLAVVAVANAVISLFCYLRFIAPIYFADPSAEMAVLDRASGITVGVTALAVLLAGLFAGWLLLAMPAGQLLPG